MPSAARQKLSPELWRHGKNSNLSFGLGNSYGSFGEVQVSPGQFDFVPDEKQQYHSHKKGCNKFKKRQFQGRKSPKALSHTGSGAGTLSDPESDNFERSYVAEPRPASSVGSSEVSKNSSESNSDVYAMESVTAPDPSELPFPPLEWLQLSSGKASPVSSEFCSSDLKKLFACAAIV